MNHIWVAAYSEIGNDIDNHAFGCLCGKFYDTMEAAWDAIKKDVEEYKNCFGGGAKAVYYGKSMRAEVIADGVVKCVWEPQLLHK